MILRRKNDISMPIKAMGKRSNYGDCKLILLNHLLDYYELDYSIKDIFGLSSALNFEVVSVKINRYECFGVKGRNLDAERDFCKENKIEMIAHNYKKSDENKIIDEICEALKKNNGCMVALDRYFLKYLKIVRSHFAYHVVLITGYNSKKRIFTVVDAMASGTHEISADMLLKAMFEVSMLKQEEFALWYEIFPLSKEKLIKNKEDYKDILSRQADIFLQENGAIDGIKSVVSFLKNIKSKAMEDDGNKYNTYIKFQIPLLYSVIFEQEFSGTFYRKIYFDFIRELIASNKVNIIDKSNIEKLCELDEAAWVSISSKMKERKRFNLNQIDDLVYNLENIISYENDIFKILKGDTVLC